VGGTPVGKNDPPGSQGRGGRTPLRFPVRPFLHAMAYSSFFRLDGECVFPSATIVSANLRMLSREILIKEHNVAFRRVAAIARVRLLQ